MHRRSLRTLVSSLGATAAIGIVGVIGAPSASAHWADACQYQPAAGYRGMAVMCPKSIPGTQFAILATCSDGVKRSSPMTLQGNWAKVTCGSYTYQSGLVQYR